MRTFQNECVKFFCSPMIWAVTAFFLLLNAVLLYTWELEDGVPAEAYKKAYTYFTEQSSDGMTELEEQYNQVQGVLFDYDEYDGAFTETYTPVFSDDIWTEYMILSDLYDQKNTIETYEEYLKQIQRQAAHDSSVSIFAESDPYAEKTAIKTANAFSGLEETELSFVNSNMFLNAVNFSATDFLVLLILFMMLYYLVIWEQEQGLISLQMTLLHGRAHVMGAKIMVLLLGSILINLLFWGSNLFIAWNKYGSIQFSAPIQSVQDFIGCTLPITIGQYWILFLAIKIIVCFTLSVCCLYLSFRCRRVQMVWLLAAIFFVVSYVLYSEIDGKSVLAVFKYCNVIPVLNVNALFHYYFHINIAGYPVTAGWMIPVFSILLFMIFGGLTLLHATPKYMLPVREKKIKNRKAKKINVAWSLLRYEAYKGLILQKGLLILCVFIAFQVIQTIQKDTTLTYQEQQYKSYMEQMEGAVTEEKRAWITEERERLDQYNAMLMEAKEQYDSGEITEQEWNAVQKLVSEQTRNQEAFALVEQRLVYLENYEIQHGIDPGFVYESGYEYLSGNSYSGNQNDQIHAMLLIVISILIFAPLFSMEYTSGMIRLLSVCSNGKKITIHKKLILSFEIAVVVFLVVYIPDLIYAIRTYGIESLSAICAAIPSMENYGVMTLLQYFCIVYLVRFLSYLCMLLLFFRISVWVRNTTKSIMAGMVLFIFPLFSSMLGVTLADYVTFNIFITGNQYMKLLAGDMSLVLLIPISVGIASRMSLSAAMYKNL